MKNQLLLLMIVLLSSIVIASPSFYIQSGAVQIINIPCLNNNSFTCDSSVLCNISINYPNGSQYIRNTNMSYDYPYFTYNFTNTTRLGEYQCMVSCSDGVNSNSSSFSIGVTSNGKDGKDYSFIFAAAFLVIFLLIISYLLDAESFGGLKLICLLFSIIFAVMIPAYFIISDLTLLFWQIFMGFIGTFVIICMIYGIKWALETLGLTKK